MMTAVRALHGTRVISVLAISRSRREVNTREPMMAGTLQPAAAISGMTARPCRPTCRINRSLRYATAFT